MTSFVRGYKDSCRHVSSGKRNPTIKRGFQIERKHPHSSVVGNNERARRHLRRNAALEQWIVLLRQHLDWFRPYESCALPTLQTRPDGCRRHHDVSSFMVELVDLFAFAALGLGKEKHEPAVCFVGMKDRTPLYIFPVAENLDWTAPGCAVRRLRYVDALVVSTFPRGRALPHSHKPLRRPHQERAIRVFQGGVVVHIRHPPYVPRERQTVRAAPQLCSPVLDPRRRLEAINKAGRVLQDAFQS
mmetsp:Transcript_9232/g.17280  ORF Transcript_9232/g.17280 Transcript_9232/m.17280 type:complete len:244 (+) Transcript_9232:740-1471(+)